MQKQQETHYTTVIALDDTTRRRILEELDIIKDLPSVDSKVDFKDPLDLIPKQIKVIRMTREELGLQSRPVGQAMGSLIIS